MMYLNGQRGFAMLLLPWILAIAGSMRVEAQTKSNEARDAVGILLDNQDRCLELSYGRLAIIEAGLSRVEQRRELKHYIREVSRESVDVAKKALEVAQRLVRGIDEDGRVQIKEMLYSQQSLCKWATSNEHWDDAENLLETIRVQSDRFATARASLPSNLQLNSSQYDQVFQKYRGYLFGVSSWESISEQGNEFEDDFEQLTPEQYQRKKKAYDQWLADQERQEAEKVRRQAQRRAELEERSKQQPRAMPKVTLKVPEEPNEPAPPPARVLVDSELMVAWHTDYSAKIIPFKRSLAEFLKVRSPNRTQIMFTACLDLARVSEKVLEDPTALESPDPAVAKRLREAITYFKRASDGCVINRLKMTREAVADGERALSGAIQELKPYDLGL